MVRTRFAPSPTGFMHVGNLRTALYEYLVAKSQGGTFVLRIEDTDQERYVEGATDVIYRTLQQVGLKHDEGPDVGGAYGPYIQSERKDLYKPYAEQLVREGKAYYCFCTKERLESIHAADSFGGYDRHCRDLPAEEVQRLLDAGTPYVIRQKMPLDGATSFEDAVYGTITIENKEIEDQILLKSGADEEYLRQLAGSGSGLMYMPIVRTMEEWEKVKEYDINVCAAELIFDTADHPFARPEFLKSLREQGIAPWVNAITLNDTDILSGGLDDNHAIADGFDENWGRLMDMGFQILQTDWPALLRGYIDRKYNL